MEGELGMDLNKKVEELIATYQIRFEALVAEMCADFARLKGAEAEPFEEVPLGEARKVAILTECYESELLEIEWGRYTLSEIAKKYVREPASIGVFFRPDVNLMETRGDKNQRFVTEKGRQIVEEFKRKYGEDWLSQYQDLLRDPDLKASYKIKMAVK